ncbi:universal stress protein [Porphyromonas crevioricanis]|uniref:Universal stress protein n=1 Tax=Porphyromonas crevioricanis TaxID=393921 RepID=A0A0A2G0N4_9PORP|nr:universal stress protein [Porphyromonas crevioricanis]KGN88847.1 universal stress protein [Porphyromonas crevioricanis]KGN95880.1 universal stress protein [Porphyromonas crevioricanis]GAD06913.1 UspA [Porphyromonas crevioricanis JCM 13913]SQH73515.1 universal stress protein F [Porphyromonas crevioricanis]
MSESKLVTIAIHTYEKAQILKTLLESEGIETQLHNVNQIQPVVSAGVRVRIKETDLPKALRIIEDNKWDQEEKDVPEEKPSHPSDYVLIPVDFSEYSMKICELGFNFAHRKGLNVVLFHVHFTPIGSAFFSIGDAAMFQVPVETNLSKELAKANRQMSKLKKELRERVAAGELPEVKFTSIIRNGTPEDVILSYSRRHPPVIIIMGTRGKSRKDSDLIGSVAAEVIDSSRVPVLVIPEEVPFNDLKKADRVAVATSFDQRDMVLFDSFMELLGSHINASIRLFNISTSTPEWNEVQLKAIQEYYKHYYPNIDISYNPLDPGDFSLALEKFIRMEDIDMIVVNTYRRNFFSQFFNPSMARRMLFHAGTPLLVMHGKRS